MRFLSQTIFSIALLLAFTSVPALAQTKIATVDLKKVFESYYKTRLATQAIQERADDLQKDYTSMAQDLKKQGDQYQATLASANDQAVSEDERSKRKLAADGQLKQLQERKLAIDQFQNQAQVTISDQRQRMRDNILKEIKQAVADKAKAAGDTMVFDTDATTVNGTPTLVYAADTANDLTDAVLKQLNAGAPTDLPDTSAPVFVSTNSTPFTDPMGGTALPSSTPQ